MTDRLSGFQVTMRTDVRDDDAEAVISAIRMIKGVADVRPILAENYNPEVIRQRIEMSEKLRQLAIDVLK